MKFHTFDDQDLTDLLFDTNLSVVDIARDLYLPETAVRRRIRELGLGWVRKSSGNASRGQATLTRIMKKLLPGENVISEHPVGAGLRLDVYCPKFKIAAEYHGRQHFEYIQHFHKDIYGFEASQERDQKKQELCDEQGIALVVFRYNDELTENVVFERLLDALQQAPVVEKEEKRGQFKGNPYYEAYNQRQREYRRQAYRKMKLQRGKRS